MKTKFLIGIIVFLFSCSGSNETSQESATQQEVETIAATTTSSSAVAASTTEPDSLQQLKQSILASRLDFDRVESFFKYSGIKKIDSSTVFIPDHFRQLSSDEYYAAFQDTSDYFYDEYSLAYYYSNQGEWNGYKRYIFVKIDEVCCIFYYYNIYDQTGKKVNSFIIASRGGEGGWTIDEDVITLNDSTFQQTRVECEYGLDEEQNEMAECDSVITIFSLTGNGGIDRVEASKRTYRKK
jgi:hypothetical protein